MGRGAQYALPESYHARQGIHGTDDGVRGLRGKTYCDGVRRK